MGSLPSYGEKQLQQFPVRLVIGSAVMSRFPVTFPTDIHTCDLKRHLFCTFQRLFYTAGKSLQGHVPLAPGSLCVFCSQHILINRQI